MARTRQIKPEFFKNETLVSLGWETMLLFAGLWTLADREGRLRDRVPVIHGELFPYSKSIPIDEMLSTLGESGFIQRYTFEGQNYIQITNFKKHQKPHPNEAQSVIPDFNQCQKPSIPKVEATRACINSTFNTIDSVIDDTPPFAVCDKVEKQSALSVLNKYVDDNWPTIWKRYGNPDKGKPLFSLEGLKDEFAKMRAYAGSHERKVFERWNELSTGGGYIEGVPIWIGDWLLRSFNKPTTLRAPISAKQEADHYASHRRTGVDTGFTKIGDVE